MKNSKFFKIIGICLSALMIVGAVSLPNLFGTSAAVVVADCDINRDGIVNGKDAVRIMKYIRKPALFPYDAKVDINGDGSITRSDIIALRNYYGEHCEIPSDENAPTYSQLVEKIIEEAAKIVKFTDDNNFIYGDAQLNPAYNWLNLNINETIDGERASACNRLVSWAYHRAGYTDQRFYRGGFNDADYARFKFEKITNVNDVRRGDIVLVLNGEHQFICAGPNLRYDHGSIERIQRTGAYSYVNGTTEPFREAISSFTYAWRPNPAGLPKSSLKEIYNTPTANIARPAASTTTVYTTANSNGNIAANYRYNPFNAQYEFHLNASATADSLAAGNCLYVGARLPKAGHSPTEYGGLWLGFRNEPYAYLYTGIGCSEENHGEGLLWYKPLAKIALPESFASLHKIVVVDSGNTIKYFMYTSAGVEYLICSININTEYDIISVRDHNNKFIYSGRGTYESVGYFSTWEYYTNTNQTSISIKKAT